MDFGQDRVQSGVLVVDRQSFRRPGHGGIMVAGDEIALRCEPVRLRACRFQCCQLLGRSDELTGLRAAVQRFEEVTVAFGRIMYRRRRDLVVNQQNLRVERLAQGPRCGWRGRPLADILGARRGGAKIFLSDMAPHQPHERLAVAGLQRQELLVLLDRGAGIPWKGNYSSWLEQKQKRLEVEEKKASARSRTLARELDWIRMSPRARQAKGKARISAYEKLLSEGEEAGATRAEIAIPMPQRLGDVVVEAQEIHKAFGDKLLIDDFSFSLPPGGIVGVIGANGAGKSTLFRMIVGEDKPDRGEMRLGETVQLGYVDQVRDALDPEKTVWEMISDGEERMLIGRREIPSRAYVSSFNFKGTDQQKRVGDLSGGERNRVHLARLLKGGGNVLLLDEPTNDLDVDTLRALEDAVLQFAGCVVVISHDRWFLDRIATHILAFEGDSRVEYFEGNYQDYEKDRRRRLGDDAERPHRIKYRRIDG